MPRTFNRRPLQVNVPNKNDVQNYFLNQVNWKGMIQNKNFLAVDQESFEDVSNIYVDNYNVLKSRPSVKRVDLKNDTINSLDIDYVHYFDELTIYHAGEILYVVKDDVVVNTLVVGNLSQYKLLQVKDFVIIFSTLGIMGLKADGTKYVPDVYVPKTKLVSVDGKESNLESKNIFTDKEITVYLYTSENNNMKTDLLNKKVKLEIDGSVFNFTFDENISYRLFNDFLKLPNSVALNKTIKTNSTSTSYTIRYIPLTISSKNTYAYYDKDTRSVYYSVDGKIFKNVLTLTEDYLFTDEYMNNIEIRFCRNNPAIITLLLKASNYTGAALYMLSVEPDLADGSLRYPNLTLIKRLSGLHNQYGNYDAIDYNHYAYTNPISTFDIFIHTPDGEDFNTELISRLSNAPITALAYYSAFMYLNDRTLFCNINFDLGTNNGNYIVRYDIAENTYVSLAAGNVAYDFSAIGNDAYAYGIAGPYPYEIAHITTSIVKTTHSQLAYIKNNFLYKGGQLYRITDNEPLGSIVNSGTYYILNNQNYSSYVYSYNILSGYVIVKSTNISEVLELEVMNDVTNDYNSFVPSHLNNLDNLFISDGKNLYISQNTENDSIYFPEINKQTFLSNITNLHPLSEREMGVFLDDEIWYTYTSDSNRFYVKSRLDFGCKEGNDVITSFDGKYTLFDTERGFAALAYQDFVASTEQSVTFISDTIKPLYNEFRSKTVKLTKYEDYLFLYDGVNTVLVYDFRSNSWWPWTITSLSTIINDKELILIKNGKICHFDFTSIKYYDFVFNKEEIDWTITSQKLHLNANNNYKHIVNITFSAVENDDAKTLLSINLKVKNYRHFVDDGKEEVFDYRVQMIRTFVKRLNYSKVREFQYTLSMDKENTIKLPLSLSAISIKYKVGGQVR